MQDLFDGQYMGHAPGPFRYRLNVVSRHTEGFFRNGTEASMRRESEPKYEVRASAEVWVARRNVDKATARQELEWLRKQCWDHKKDRNRKKGDKSWALSSTLSAQWNGSHLVLTVSSGAHKLENQQKADVKLAAKAELLRQFLEQLGANESQLPAPPLNQVVCSEPKESYSQQEGTKVKVHVFTPEQRSKGKTLIDNAYTKLRRAKRQVGSDLPLQTEFLRLNGHELMVRVPKDALKGKDLQAIVSEITKAEKGMHPPGRSAY